MKTPAISDFLSLKIFCQKQKHGNFRRRERLNKAVGTLNIRHYMKK